MTHRRISISIPVARLSLKDRLRFKILSKKIRVRFEIVKEKSIQKKIYFLRIEWIHTKKSRIHK
ncbi:hypothetical protein CH380_04825 [Leptospira adleri]|uniref:Uncharacterized protein n=1 Tax=Leptospira adleri TaxID=2023186 RepID=A0A2M9YS86_9LEPT|nr:hypothetical protein CH380_04825 [Leptospira adleri]PJZ62793.1 hypothetical protein CH376_06500 [Leptospira adleri]